MRRRIAGWGAWHKTALATWGWGTALRAVRSIPAWRLPGWNPEWTLEWKRSQSFTTGRISRTHTAVGAITAAWRSILMMTALFGSRLSTRRQPTSSGYLIFSGVL